MLRPTSVDPDLVPSSKLGRSPSIDWDTIADQPGQWFTLPTGSVSKAAVYAAARTRKMRAEVREGRDGIFVRFVRP